MDATSRHSVSEAIKLLLRDDVALLEDISDPSSCKEHCLTFLNAISIAETSPPYDVPLHPDDCHLTTFITPWGHYHYCTAPQGYLASGNGYTCCYDEIVADIPQKTKCIDDTLLWSNSIEESFWQVVNWLDICGHNGIILHKDKFVFASDTIEFAGFQIGPDSVIPCLRYLKAILGFPTPKNITDACSWFGLLNQVFYTFSMAIHMQPF